MSTKTFGFIGGGRITNIFLNGFKRAEVSISDAAVSDIDAAVLDSLKRKFPEIVTFHNNNVYTAENDIVILAVHPNETKNVLSEIADCLKSDSVLISLVPKFSIAKISELLGGKDKIVRMIPNAPSYINKGYNPIVFSDSFSSIEKDEMKYLFGALGKCIEVEEEKLEAYAVLTAMGPTYFWFQFNELVTLGKSFGLSENELRDGITGMLKGSVDMIFKSGLGYEDVINLIPSKPLGDEEERIINSYKQKLEKLYARLKI